MRKATIILLALSALLFIGSGLVEAVMRWNTQPSAVSSVMSGIPDSAILMPDQKASPPIGLSVELWQPGGTFQMTLLLVIWAAAIIYVLRAAGLIGRIRTGGSQMPARPAPLTEILAVALGLALAALVPWALRQPSFWGFVLASVSFAAILFAALNRQIGRVGQGPSISLGILAAGATLLLCSAFALMVERGLPVSSTIAALLAILCCAFIATKVQLSMGSPIAYSLTIIWAFLGLLVATMNVNPMIATAAVLAIAFVGAALVRVAS